MKLNTRYRKPIRNEGPGSGKVDASYFNLAQRPGEILGHGFVSYGPLHKSLLGRLFRHQNWPADLLKVVWAVLDMSGVQKFRPKSSYAKEGQLWRKNDTLGVELVDQPSYLGYSRIRVF